MIKFRQVLQTQKPDRPFPPEITPGNLRKILASVKPYTFKLLILVGVAVLLSFLTGLTQLALTPMLTLVLDPTGAQSAGASSELDLNSVGPTILGFFSDWTGLTDPWQLLAVSSLAYLALALMVQVLSFGSKAWMTRIRMTIAADLEHKLFGHILQLPLSFIHKYPAGWLFSRVDHDVRMATVMFADLVIDGLSSLLVSLFYVIVLMRTSLSLTVFAAVAGLVQIGLTQLMSRYTKRFTRDTTEATAQLQAFSLERLTALREVKALAGELHETAAFRQKINVYRNYAIRQGVYKRIEQPLRWSINRIVLITVMLFGAWQTLNGEMSTAAFILFMFFAQSLIGPLASLAEMMLSVVEIRTMLNGPGYLLSQAQEADGMGRRIADGFKDSVVFRNVSFAYEELPVLSNINLTIRQGEMVALVGRSGAGKSTLVDLLMRFYMPIEGHIEMDGTPINEFDLSAYRQLFGVVSQDGTLFNETVHANIAYARPFLTREDVERAARVANAEEFILNDLSDGYDTMLGERGVRLSGGQRQRISIARAVAHRPSILILDEATSSLDTESERLVQDAISQVVKGYTAVVIAHRLSTIMMADRIVVLRDGEIVETGTHQELYNLNGEYRYLYDLQFHPENVEIAEQQQPG